MTVCTSPKELIADLATAASVVQLEQTEALQRITGENMRMEEELKTLKGENEAAAKGNQQKATEIKDLKAKHADLTAKFQDLERDTIRITTEALVKEQDLRSERSKLDAERDLSARLTRENGTLKRQLSEALATISRLQGDLASQQTQLREHIERIQWIEESIGSHETGAAEIEGKMQCMVDILDQTSTKIEGLEGALTEARAKAHVLGERCHADKSQWTSEKGVLHALVNSMQKKLAQREEEQRDFESRASASAMVERILWNVLRECKEREIEAKKAQVKVGVEVSAKTKAAHIDSLDEWLKCGIPVIKWGRNNKPYPRLVRVSADGKALEWMKMGGKGGWGSQGDRGVRSFPLKDISSINTSEAGKSAREVLYTVEVGLPERVVRMDLASPKGFLWFHTLKSRGLNIR